MTELADDDVELGDDDRACGRRQSMGGKDKAGVSK